MLLTGWSVLENFFILGGESCSWKLKAVKKTGGELWKPGKILTWERAREGAGEGARDRAGEWTGELAKERAGEWSGKRA